MKKLYDFKCLDCLKKFEAFVENNQGFTICKCGSAAPRLVSAPKCFQNTVGRSPSAAG
jgi:hypothetical protein